MKMRKRLSLMLALALVTGSLVSSTTAVESQISSEPVSAIERASGWFNETVSAGKTKKLGSAISLQAGEIINFSATYSPSDASMDFGLVDSNNVFYYITSTTGLIDGDVAAPTNGSYTPAIRNNSSNAVSVSGKVATGIVRP